MRYGGFCGLSKKHLSTERDINLVHKLHLQKEKKRKKTLEAFKKVCKAARLSMFFSNNNNNNNGNNNKKFTWVGWFCEKDDSKTSTEILSLLRDKTFFFCLRTTNKSELCSGKKEEIVQVLRCLMKNLSSDWLMGQHDNKKRKKEKRKVKRRWVTEARRVWFGWASLWFRLGQNEKFWGNVWI